MSFSPSVFLREVWAVYFALLKILVPALLAIIARLPQTRSLKPLKART